MYNPTSISRNLEYGANIYKQNGRYTYRDTREGSESTILYAMRNDDYGILTARVQCHGAYTIGEDGKDRYASDDFSKRDLGYARGDK